MQSPLELADAAHYVRIAVDYRHGHHGVMNRLQREFTVTVTVDVDAGLVFWYSCVHRGNIIITRALCHISKCICDSSSSSRSRSSKRSSSRSGSADGDSSIVISVVIRLMTRFLGFL